MITIQKKFSKKMKNAKLKKVKISCKIRLFNYFIFKMEYFFRKIVKMLEPAMLVEIKPSGEPS